MLPELDRRRGWIFIVGAATAFAELVIDAAADPAYEVARVAR